MKPAPLNSQFDYLRLASEFHDYVLNHLEIVLNYRLCLETTPQSIGAYFYFDTFVLERLLDCCHLLNKFFLDLFAHHDSESCIFPLLFRHYLDLWVVYVAGDIDTFATKNGGNAT